MPKKENAMVKIIVKKNKIFVLLLIKGQNLCETANAPNKKSHLRKQVT